MARRLSPQAKAPLDRDDAGTKVMLPEPIDHDPRRERMGGAREPRRQLTPATPRADRRRRAGDEDPRKPARHDLAPGGRISADEHRRILKALVPRARHAAILNDHAAGNLHRGLLLQAGLFSAEAVEALPRVVVEPGIPIVGGAGKRAGRPGEEIEGLGARGFQGNGGLLEPAGADLRLDPPARRLVERTGDDAQLGHVAAKARARARAGPTDSQGADVGGFRHRLDGGARSCQLAMAKKLRATGAPGECHELKAPRLGDGADNDVAIATSAAKDGMQSPRLLGDQPDAMLSGGGILPAKETLPRLAVVGGAEEDGERADRRHLPASRQQRVAIEAHHRLLPAADDRPADARPGGIWDQNRVVGQPVPVGPPDNPPGRIDSDPRIIGAEAEQLVRGARPAGRIAALGLAFGRLGGQLLGESGDKLHRLRSLSRSRNRRKGGWRGVKQGEPANQRRLVELPRGGHCGGRQRLASSSCMAELPGG